MKKVCFILLLIFFSGTAFAASDLIATYQYSDGNMMTICARDNDHVRMDTSETSFLLLKDNKIYSATKDDDGQWHVMDMEKMKGMMSSAKGMFGSDEPEEMTTKLKKTGRTETVAGYKGVVYDYELFENGSQVGQGEMVLSSNSNVMKVNQAWQSLMKKAGDMMGQDMSQLIEQSTKEIGDQGLLRYDSEMKLVSLKKMSLDASYYELPANSREMQMSFSAQPQQASQPAAAPASEPSMLEEDAKDVGQAARDETKDATIDEVREGVRGLFNSIFD